MGDPEDEEEEEEEKKKGEEDEEEEENDGEEDEVPWQVTVPCPLPQLSPHYRGARECF